MTFIPGQESYASELWVSVVNFGHFIYVTGYFYI